MNFELIANNLLKITAVLIAAPALACLFRKSSAATLHLFWLAAIAAVLLAPLVSFSISAPAWSVPATASSARPLPAIEAPGPPQAAPAPARPIAAFVIWSIWALGFFFVSTRFSIRLARLHRLTLRAAPAAQIRYTNEVSVPLTWGFLRPVILLPAAARHWPASRTAAALAHERAHIERHDWLTQTLATIACAIYWFHPLIWLSARQMAKAAERASDDNVLAALDSGRNAPDYAAELVEIARASTARPSAALAMAGPAQALKGRIRAILDPAQSRRRPTPASVAACLTVLAAALLLVSMPSVSAQTFSGTLSGTVRDVSGAVIPGVSVGAQNRDGNNQEATRTDAAGHYVFLGLPDGRYSVTFQMPGFKPFQSAVVQVAGQAANMDATLDIGGVFEQVEVLGHGPLAPPSHAPQQLP